MGRQRKDFYLNDEAKPTPLKLLSKIINARIFPNKIKYTYSFQHWPAYYCDKTYTDLWVEFNKESFPLEA